MNHKLKFLFVEDGCSFYQCENFGCDLGIICDGHYDLNGGCQTTQLQLDFPPV